MSIQSFLGAAGLLAVLPAASHAQSDPSSFGLASSEASSGSLGALQVPAVPEETVVLESWDFRRADDLSIEELAHNAPSTEELVINLVATDLAKGLERTLRGDLTRAWLLENLRKRPAHAQFVHFTELFAAFPQARVDVELALASRWQGFLGGYDGLAGRLVHRGLSYYPVINVPNVDVASDHKAALISPGIEIEDIPELGIADDLFAWDLSEPAPRPIRLGEAEALATMHPLFVVSLETQQPTAVTRRDAAVAPPPPVAASGFLAWLGWPWKPKPKGTYFHSHEFQINHRYDSSNNSEFAICGTRWSLASGGSYTHTEHILYNVHKSKIGQQLYHWTWFCNNYTPYADNWVHFNTYERDWYSTGKGLGTAANGIPLIGKRKFSDEWYTFDPGTSNFTTTNRVDLDYIYANWAYWYSNSKGNFRIWRVEL